MLPVGVLAAAVNAASAMVLSRVLPETWPSAFVIFFGAPVAIVVLTLALCRVFESRPSRSPLALSSFVGCVAYLLVVARFFQFAWN